MEIRLLGPIEVEAHGQRARLGGPRQRAVLAFLAINANEVMSTERIADEIWAGEPPRAAPTTLQGYVFHLRKALGDGPAKIETRAPGYILRVDPDIIDVRRGERLIAQANDEKLQGRVAPAAALLRDALALWRGEPLADFAYEQFAEAEISRLTELRLTAIEARIEADLACGQHDQLVAEIDSLVRAHPLREALRGHLMLALHRSGRTADALRVYSEGRELLLDELGIDPGLSLQRLERAILMQDPEVEAAPEPALTPIGNLPAVATTFVGREQELRDVAGFFGRHRLVTLTGAGGSGKTRLAIEGATRLSSGYRDGAWLVELAGLGDAELVPTALASALGVADEPDRGVLDGLIDHLRARSALLVVDNCEHLVEAVADVVDALLRACPRLHVLATSREALGVEGELAWPVPSLSVPDPTEPATLDELVEHAAVALFVDRASTARTGFTASDANIATIVSVCRQLDGMPLAIELAAARLAMLTIDQLAARLEDRFALLTSKGRTGVSRHRTLRATIDWSYESLNDSERTLFDRLSVFAGTFTLERAETVCATDPVASEDILDLLTALVNKSLVVRVDGDNGGFRLLETLRHYGGERLRGNGDADVFHARHAAAITAAAVEGTAGLRGPDGRAWLDRLEAEYDDSRAALEWALEFGDRDGAAALAAALWPFWWHRSSITEGRSWLRRVLAADPSPAWRLAALVGATRLATMDHDLSASTAAGEEGLALVDELGDARARGELLVDQAEVLLAQGQDTERAVALADEAVGLLRGAGATWGEANATRLLTLLTSRGDAARAESHAAACLALFESCGDVAGSAGARFMLARLAQVRGDLPQAMELGQQSLVQFREMRDRWGVADATRMLGEIALGVGDTERASQLAAESLRLAEDIGHHRGVAASLLLFAQTMLTRGQVERARAFCAQAVEFVRSRQLIPYLVGALTMAAQVALADDDPNEADSRCEEALAQLGANGMPALRATPLALRGLARARMGDHESALESLNASLELAQAAHDGLRAARALEAMAEASLLAGDLERAARYLSAARTTRGDISATLSGPERDDHERVLAAVRAGLGDSQFARTWEREWHDTIIDVSARSGHAPLPSV